MSHILDFIKFSEKHLLLHMQVEKIEYEIFNEKFLTSHWVHFEDWLQIYDGIQKKIANLKNIENEIFEEELIINSSICVKWKNSPFKDYYRGLTAGTDKDREFHSHVILVEITKIKNPLYCNKNEETSIISLSSQEINTKGNSFSMSEYDPVKDVKLTYVPYTPSTKSRKIGTSKNEDCLVKEEPYSPKPIESFSDESCANNDDSMSPTSGNALQVFVSQPDEKSTAPRYTPSVITPKSDRLSRMDESEEKSLHSDTQSSSETFMFKKKPNSVKKRLNLSPMNVNRYKKQRIKNPLSRNSNQSSLSENELNVNLGSSQETNGERHSQSQLSQHTKCKTDDMFGSDSESEHKNIDNRIPCLRKSPRNRKNLLPNGEKSKMYEKDRQCKRNLQPNYLDGYNNNEFIKSKETLQSKERMSNTVSHKARILKIGMKKTKDLTKLPPKKNSTSHSKLSPKSEITQYFPIDRNKVKSKSKEEQGNKEEEGKTEQEKEMEILRRLQKELEKPIQSKKLKIRSLRHLEFYHFVSIFEKNKPYFDQLVENYKAQTTYVVKQIDGISPFLLTNMISHSDSLLMLDYLNNVYEKDSSIIRSPCFSDLFLQRIVPEWILKAFMIEYKMSRESAIERIQYQFKYDLNSTIIL